MTAWLPRIGASVFALMAFAAGARADDPLRTTATYDQWQLRCENRAVSGKPTKACEIIYAIQITGPPQFVVQVAVGRGGAEAPHRMVFQVPTGVWLPAGVEFRLTDKTPPSKAIYKRCLPNACLADVEAIDPIVKAIRDGQATQGTLNFQVQEGQPVTIPISYQGFISAYDALMDAEKQQ